MAIFSSQSSYPRMDLFSRLLIVIASFFSIAALTLLIVGIATYSWYYSKDANGNLQYYNLFTICTGNEKNNSVVCSDIQQTDIGVGTQHAAALLIVAVCLLGCGMLVILAMNFIQCTGILIFIAPITLFLAVLFMVGGLAEGSRVTIYNSYSATLVQTGQLVTVFSLGLIAFASGRLHSRYYERF